MLGFSLGKLLLLVLLLAAVWFGFRYMSRIDAVRRTLREELARRQRQPPTAPRVQAEDLVKCSACGAYVAAASAGNCGRADCPWGRAR
jgi:uncharacterized protein